MTQCCVISCLFFEKASKMLYDLKQYMIHPQRVAISHIGALQLALVNGFRNVLILENDVLWRVSSNKMNLLLLQELVERPFDVIIFGGTFVHHDEDHRARHSYAASSYFVNGEYVNTLISNFQEGLLKLNLEPQIKSSVIFKKDS
jgi:hypothetical protein